jgi:hypothetical protein
MSKNNFKDIESIQLLETTTPTLKILLKCLFQERTKLLTSGLPNGKNGLTKTSGNNFKTGVTIRCLLLVRMETHSAMQTLN